MDISITVKSQLNLKLRVIFVGIIIFIVSKQFILFLMLNFYSLGAIQQEKQCDKLVKSLKDDEHFGNLFNKVTILVLSRYSPANIYLLKVNNRSTKKRCEIYSTLLTSFWCFYC